MATAPPPFPRRRSRTPTVLQLEAAECGAACLGIILGHHGRHVPLAELRRACGIGRDGSKASRVVQAARAYGLEAKGLARDLDGLRGLEPPYVVFWQFNHFLVVEGFAGDRVYLNDPAGGHRTVTLKEFGEGFTGVVLWMAPGPAFARGGRRERLTPAVVSRLRGRLGALAYCLVAGLLTVLPALVTSACAAAFVDSVLLEGRARWVRPLVWLLLAAAAGQFALQFVQAAGLRRARVALAAREAGRFVWRLLQLPMAFFAARYPGEVGHRLRLADKVAVALTGKVAGTGVDLATMALYAAVMACFSPLLAGIAAALAMLNFLALRAVYARRTEASQRLAQDEGRLAAASIAGIQAVETLKASGMEAGYFAKWAGFQGKAAVARQELERSALGVGVLPALLDGLTVALVLSVGGWQVMGGALSLGALVGFQLLLHRYLAPVEELVRTAGSLQELHADILRLDDVLLTAPAVEQESGVRGQGSGNPRVPRTPPGALIPQDSSWGSRAPGGGFAQPGERPGDRLRGELEVVDLTFGYTPQAPPVIEGVSLHARPGQWLALVGGSGSGKSTVARLVAGLYEPWSGEVRFDGQPRSALPRETLTGSVGFVDQDTLLFAGTVRDNLTLWDGTVGEEELLAACRDAEALEVIRRLPGGLDAELLEGGANLSGGERQRLEIARVLVGHPSLLVLDEATSALDVEMERRVAENLRRRGCTCLWIAHRLSTVRGCDEIVVLEGGKVVERGPHGQLLTAGGRYAELVGAEVG